MSKTIRGYGTAIVYDQTGLVVEYRVPDDMPKFVVPTLVLGDPCWKPLGRLGVTAPALEVWPLPEWWPGYGELMEQVALYDANAGASYDWGRPRE